MIWSRRVFLSVQVPAKAARAILHTEAAALNSLLAAIGPDRALVDEPEPLTPGWPAWDLETALWALPGIGRAKATKLIARKRPRPYPSWDSVVSEVLGTERAHLNPVRGPSRRRRRVASPVAVDPGGGRPPRGDLRAPGLRRDRVDGRQESRLRRAL
ncbi:hypothetical protein GFS60_07284 (plasmid) [Rhodococcus sp. WAY2]|nr:hypothetical protein GFS60_07284 [Rhodococcus sp. WAY2]